MDRPPEQSYSAQIHTSHLLTALITPRPSACAPRPSPPLPTLLATGPKSAKSLLLYNLDALLDLRGLEGLAALPGDLYLADNGRLRTLTGLDGLRSVGGDLALLSNMMLISVQGLQVGQGRGGE